MIQLDSSSIPSVFIGSSSEGLQVAHILQSQIDGECRAYVWDQGLFTPGSYPMEVLDKQIKTRDFAVFICSPDDPIVKRNQESIAVRDNVIFELGLFMGAIGRERAFLVVPSRAKLELPSDLAAITQLRYNDEQFALSYQDQIAAMRPPCLTLRNAIQVSWKKMQDDRKQRFQISISDSRYKSLRRLYTVIVQLRDLIIVFPGQLLESLSDFQRFEEVKSEAASSVDKAVAAFHDDAISANLVPELEELAKATKAALIDFPFPIDASITGMSAANIFKKNGANFVSNVIAKEEPLANIGNMIESELDKQLRGFVMKYESWWRESHRAIERATDRLQDFQIYRTPRLRRESRRVPKSSCSCRRHRSMVLWSTSASASRAAHKRISPRISAVGDRGRRFFPL